MITFLLMLTSLIILSSYVIYTIIDSRCIPYSVSETYYRIRHKSLFQVVMVLTAGTMLPSLLNITPDRIQFLSFLSCAGMLMVAASPDFNDKFEGKVHSVGAALTLICSQVLVGFLEPYFLLVWIPYFIYLLASGLKNKSRFMFEVYHTKPMFWIEALALLTTYTTGILSCF